MLLIRRVEGLSMLPHYNHGNIIFAWRLSRPRVGDVVIAKHHRIEMIKRVTEISDYKVFLRGDNPEESTDSRQFGWLPMQSVLGVVIGSRANAKAESE